MWLLFLKTYRPDLCTFCCDQEFLDLGSVFCFLSRLCICRSLSNSNAILPLINGAESSASNLKEIVITWNLLGTSVGVDQPSCCKVHIELAYKWFFRKVQSVTVPLGRRDGALPRGTDSCLWMEIRGLRASPPPSLQPSSTFQGQSVVTKFFLSPGI